MPPAFGIAVVSSTLLKRPGRMMAAARTHDSGIAAPAPAAPDQEGGDDRPVQEPLPDEAEQAAREAEEEEKQSAIAAAEMETVADRLDGMRARGLFNDEEVVELRKVLELEGKVRRGG